MTKQSRAEHSVVTLIDAGSRKAVARGWEEGQLGAVVNGYRVSVLQDEKVLEFAQQCEHT